MAIATASDGVRLSWNETGAGTPIVFVHEFADDARAWDAQVPFFAERHRVVTYNARGYPASDVPPDAESYSQERAVDDLIAVLDASGIEHAHLVGCSMGGFAALHAALDHAERVASLVVSSVGYGADPATADAFREGSIATADAVAAQGLAPFARVYASGPARETYRAKDPAGWEAYVARLAELDAIGLANTMRGIQARRPLLYDLAARLETLTMPVLVIAGDEDASCWEPALFLKRTIESATLFVAPRTGHAVNVEEPALFNGVVKRFLDTFDLSVR
jgi:pimeloyl-ACP methyl ester carboxylesterase